MESQPNPSSIDEKRETNTERSPVGGDHIVIHGNVGPGANVGKGSVRADQIAGHDLIVNGVLANGQNQFGDLLTELRNLLVEAKEAGELDDQMAQEAISNVEAAVELVTGEKTPAKPTLIKKLETVVDLIDAAVDTFGAEGGVAKILLRALPIAALLVKLALRFF